ncbi:MAG: peptidylprolyl isomerase [Prevotella sp.]|nr:peptidylprolyl isomerase [Prevotella sp.]
MRRNILLSLTWLMAATAVAATADSTAQQGSVIDEVIWVVGDEPILRSEVEVMRIQAAQEGHRFKGNPDCAIPEQLALNKLFLHQAEIDSIDVSDSEVSRQVDMRIDYMVEQVGSKEKLEEYQKKSMARIKEEMHDAMRDNLTIQRMREHIVKDIKVTPADVRRHFRDMPQDSLPYVPTSVEVEIITHTPAIDQQEINRVKEELRSYTERVNSGDASFQTLARLYSEDPGSARYGGEIGFTGRTQLDPAFATVAFNLTDPKKISKVVESEFGYHIIQLIEKRGDKINVRHILKKPEVSDSAVQVAIARLDSIADDIRRGKFSFEDAAAVLSDDKDTRNNHGLMANTNEQGRTSRFRMQDLPAEVARVVDTLRVGQVSAAFRMISQQGKTQCAVVKLKSRTEGHRATIADDFQTLREVVLNARREEKLHQWVVNKIRNTYVRVKPEYRDCQYEYEGWIK